MEPIILSTIVLDAAEDGKGHELAGRWRRFLQFRIRVWNRADGLCRARRIVITNVLFNNTANVAEAEEDEVVQGFLS